jgi:hypothetical protein
MWTSRRTIAWMTVLALAIAVVIIWQRTGNPSMAADRADGAELPIGYAGTTREVSPATTPPDKRDRAKSWFAMARELSSISSDAACVQMVNEAAAFAAGEGSGTAARSERGSNDDWLLAELGKLQRKASLGDPERLLAALILRPPEERNADNPQTQTTLLEFGTRAASSGSPLLAWHALRACAESGHSCPFAHLEQDLLDMQRENAEAWALVASLRYQRGDIAGALAAMQGAANASTSNWHWPETIALVERSLVTHTGIPFPDSAALAVGAAVSAIPHPVTSVTMCREESASSRVWGEACLAFGALRQEHNETDLAKGLAYTIRRRVLTALGETERAAEVQAGYERFSAERMAGGQELMMAGARLHAALIDTERARLHAYLGAVRQFGETAGRREFLRQEAPALLERAGLLGQPAARECMAELILEARAVGGTRRAIAEHRLQAGDELHITLRDGNGSMTLTRRIGPDGKVLLPFGLSISAAGMTTEQFQRDLATTVSNGIQPPEALVIPISRRPREELGSEFDNARRGSVEKIEEPRPGG